MNYEWNGKQYGIGYFGTVRLFGGRTSKGG